MYLRFRLYTFTFFCAFRAHGALVIKIGGVLCDMAAVSFQLQYINPMTEREFCIANLYVQPMDITHNDDDNNTFDFDQQML